MYLVYKTIQGRNLSNFFGGILETWWFHKYLTFRKRFGSSYFVMALIMIAMKKDHGSSAQAFLWAYKMDINPEALINYLSN